MKRGPAIYMQEINNQTPGTLTLIHYPENILCIEWKPNDFLIADADANEQGDWSLVDTIAKRRRTASECLVFNTNNGQMTNKDSSGSGGAPTPPLPEKKLRVVRAKIAELKHIEVSKNGHQVRLVNRNDNKTHSEYFFQHGNADGFVRTLQTTHCLQRSRHNRNIYEIVEINSDVDFFDKEKLQKTFAELKIDDIKGSGGWISSMVRNPIGQTMEFLAKMSDAYTVIPAVGQTVGGYISPTRTAENTSMGGSTNDEYEVLGISPRQTSSESDSIDNQMVKDAELNLPPRQIITRGTQLTLKQWREFQSEDGRISDVERVKEMIFRGGIENSLRQEVWKYLLDYAKWDETHEQNEKRRKKKIQEYYQMKCQWLTLSPMQEKNFSDYRDRKCQIEKDVKRTDRTMPFFAGDENPNLALLKEINDLCDV